MFFENVVFLLGQNNMEQFDVIQFPIFFFLRKACLNLGDVPGAQTSWSQGEGLAEAHCLRYHGWTGGRREALDGIGRLDTILASHMGHFAPKLCLVMAILTGHIWENMGTLNDYPVDLGSRNLETNPSQMDQRI